VSGLLDGRVALVSGVGPGVGREVALALAREGAALVLAARTPARLAEVEEAVHGAGSRALGVATDVTRAEDCRRLVEEARARFGRLDVLVNNAFDLGRLVRLEDASAEDFRRPLEVNLIGSMQLAREAVPAMRAQGGGSIVMVSSMILRVPEPLMGVYAASKGALLAAARALAAEVGVHGIRVNSVVPGYIWGPNLEAWFRQQARQRGVDPQVVYGEVAAKTALRHLPTSAEIADAVLFFASDLARAITGQSLDVNGGHFFH
jgi:NAD(P)-dependent dehydrogenase (short-subunit alcohol dehydrogenase family)